MNNSKTNISIIDKLFLIICEVKYVIRRVIRIISRKVHIPDKKTNKRFGYKYSTLNETQIKILELIKSGKPMMVGRLGGIEAAGCIDAMKVEMGLKKECSKKNKERMKNNAGFFPSTTESMKKFAKLMNDSIKEVDVLGSVITNNEEYLIKRNLTKKVMMTDIGNLEPYYSEFPWSQALKGKKVLVIYPFAESIRNQYENNRSKLFKDKNILPQFELQVLQSVQSIAGNKTKFSDWFEALEYMYQEAIKLDFDIAIIGCGAYGFPLAAKLKKAGKQAIHLGGATQILFGVWGERWEHIASVKKLKNNYWIRPSKKETPPNVNKVENACYW